MVVFLSKIEGKIASLSDRYSLVELDIINCLPFLLVLVVAGSIGLCL